MDKRLPEEFLSRMQQLLADEYDAFVASYEDEPIKGLRLNPIKEGALPADVRPDPVAWCETGHYYTDDVRPGKHPYHAAGAYYIQEPSAMLPGELACIAIREVIARQGKVRVLDLCAAPGGKSTHMAGAIGDFGILIANEPVPSRARALSQNIERLGIVNCLVSVEMPEKLATVLPGYFDIVLTDVPCSGEGMFRKDDTAIEEWSPENVNNCISRGKTITDAAAALLKRGGYLIYSTCTYEKGEDEGAIEAFVNDHPGFRVTDLKVKGIEPESDGMYRIWPHKHKGEGHFAAVLRYDGLAAAPDHVRPYNDPSGIRFLPGTDGQMIKSLTEGLEDILTDEGRKQILRGSVFAYGDNLYVAPDELAELAAGGKKKANLRVERAGLHLGEVTKGRFIPSHSLALALKPWMCRRVVELNVSDERVYKYLGGESIACDSTLKGYCTVTVDGYTLGWGKATGGVLKNHYPKGLRWSP